MRTSSSVPSSFRSDRPEILPPPGDWASLITAILLVLILGAAPCVLGAARLWYELPLLEGIALLFVLQSFRLMAEPKTSRRIDAIDLAVVLFTLYAAARWLTSPTEYYSRLEVLNVVGYAILFFTSRYGLIRRVHALAPVILLAVLGVGEAGFGWYLSYHSDIHHPESLWFPFGPTEQLNVWYAPRWLGTYGCPDHYAGLLVMATGAVLALACFSKWPWPLRIVLFYLSAILLIAILYSQSRGAWISLIGAVLALTFFALRYGTLRRWVPVTVALLFFAIIGVVFVRSSIVQSRLVEVHQTLAPGQLTTYARIKLDLDALRIARDHPFFGTGPATFTFIHPRYQDSHFGVKAIYTHDDYLNCLDDYGIVGFAITMFFVFAVTLALLTRVRAYFRWAERTIVAAAFAAWCALLIHSAVDFNLHIPANAMILLSLAGLGLRWIPGEEAPRHWATISLAPLGRWLGVALFLFALAYGAEAGRTAVSDILYEKALADVAYVPTDQSIGKVQQALDYDPDNADALALLGDLYRVQALDEKDFTARVGAAQLALEAYQRALKANPLDDTIEARLGLTFDLMRRYPEAYFCYQAALEKQPYDGQFWSALGNHFMQRGLLRKADEAYLMASECPHGFEGAAQSAQQVTAILTQQGLVPPAAGTNPLEPEPEEPETQTVP